MNIVVRADKRESGRLAAEHGAKVLREAIAQRGGANIIVATGASQFEMLEALIAQPDLAWNRVTVFHLDEYVGLPLSHPASFRKYLWERFHRRLPLPPRAFHYLDGEGDAAREAERVGRILREHPIDVCFAGIGENAHLAFNDPPADFETEQPYLVVKLDEACRRQQMGEGWFPTLDSVPTHAISMSVRQMMKSRVMILTVPDERKAQAAKGAIEGPITADVPASMAQRHGDCTMYLDEPAASLLTNRAVLAGA